MVDSTSITSAAPSAAHEPSPSFTSVADLPLAVTPVWRGHLDKTTGKWMSSWPPGLCKECGGTFDGISTRRYCSDKCRRATRNRSNSHANRRRRRDRVDQRDRQKYDQFGKFELLDAFGHRCGYCGEAFAPDDEIIFAHISSVRDGGQITRKNIAPLHHACELKWNAQQE